MEESARELGWIRRVYAFWGRHPALYAASDLVTFMGRPGLVRGRAARALGVGAGASVLEVGCGTGRNLGHLVDQVGPTGHVTGLDYSRDVLEAAASLCRRRGFSNVTLVRGDAAELPVAGGFDGVISVLAVSAIPGWRAAIRRFYEVLRPGGTLVIGDACLFGGFLGVLNPLVQELYRRAAAWEPGRDIEGEVSRVFGNVRVTRLNLGTFFVLTARKEARS